MGHPQVTKMYNEENLYSVRSLVVVHVLEFQRDLAVIRFIHFELITCSTSKVDRLKIHIYIYILYVMFCEQSAFSLTFWRRNYFFKF